VILHYLNTDEIPRQNIKCSATNEIKSKIFTIDLRNLTTRII